MVNNKEEYSISIVDILTLLKRYLIIIILIGVIGGAGGLILSNYFMTPIYQAKAQMIVNTRKDLTSTVTNDQINSAKNLVPTYALIICSHAVLDPVIENLNLSISFERLKGKISVSAIEDTQVMEISVNDANPRLAEKIASEILVVAPDVLVDTVGAGSVKIVESAYSTHTPIAPNKKSYTLMGALGGVVLVAAIIILRALLDRTYKTELDVQSDLGLSVLGVIPSIESCLKVEGKGKSKKGAK